MKKNLTFLTLLFLLIGSHSFGQKFYVSPQIGYAFAHNRSAMENSYTNDELQVYEQFRYSYGKGFNVGASVGYFFNDFVGVDLGLNYLIGGKTTYKFNSDGDNYTMDLYSRMFRINPTLVLKTGGDTWEPYAKFGVIFSTGSLLSDNTLSDSNGNDFFAKTKTSGGLATGFTASLGLAYSISENIQLFGELNLESVTYAPEKAEITELTANGQDQLSALSVSEKEITFVEEYSMLWSTPVDPDSPSLELQSYEPLSSFGVNIGARFFF